MNSVLEKLFFSIGLIDKISGPSKEAVKSIKFIQKTADTGFKNIGKGAMGLAASGAGIYGLVEPAQDFSKAMGEVRSLGVAETELKKLENASLRFSMKYGESAAEFVRSSYDIQSAISGLANGELAKFTNAGAILAKGTKSNTGIITSYMGTMYGIWQDQAAVMGKTDWVNQLAGQTATAVKMFKTTGPQMAAAWSTLGSAGQKSGASMEEQMAILGTLQSSLGGAESATKYKAFLRGIGSAQEALGMQFTNSQGRMLPMVDIIDKIQARIGVKPTEANKGIIRQAFGGEEAYAFISEVLGRTKEIRASMEQLGQVKGLDGALAMAAAMTDNIDRLKSSVVALSISFGGPMLKSLEPVINLMISGIQRVQRWTEMFPKITSWAGVLALAFFSVSAAISALVIALGVIQIVWGGVLAIKAIAIALHLWTAAQWLLNIALTMNPIGLVIVAIGALIAVVGLLIYYWKDITALLSRNVFGQLILLQLTPLIATFRLLWEVIKIVWQVLTGDWGNISFAGIKNILDDVFARVKSLYDTFAGFFPGLASGIEWVSGLLVEFFSHIGNISIAFQYLGSLGSMLWSGIGTVFNNIGGVVGTLFSKLAKLPGFGFLAETVEPTQARTAPQSSQLAESRKLDIPAGGIQQSIANSKTTNFGGVTINSSQGMTPAMLEEWAALQ